MHAVDLGVEIDLAAAVVDHDHGAPGVHMLGQLLDPLALELVPHVLAHDGAGGEKGIKHNALHTGIQKGVAVLLQNLGDDTCGVVHDLGLLDAVDVHLLLVAEHGERAQRSKDKGDHGELALGCLHQLFADINVHHHAVAGMEIDILDLVVLVLIADDLILVIGVSRLVLGENQLLAPGCALDRQVDQGHDAVQVKLLPGLEQALRAGVRIRGPLAAVGPDQVAGDTRQQGIDRHTIRLLMIQRHDDALH